MCYLYMKTAEIAAFPARLLEKVKLNRNFEKAVQRELGSTSKCKQRLVKIPRYLIRMRKLKLNLAKEAKENSATTEANREKRTQGSSRRSFCRDVMGTFIISAKKLSASSRN